MDVWLDFVLAEKEQPNLPDPLNYIFRGRLRVLEDCLTPKVIQRY
jgi:hypothetical protein